MPDCTPANLKITTLGKTQIVHGGQRLSDGLLKKAQALLIYLAANPRTHSREALAGLLWSELPEEKARANLRTALNRLRGEFGAMVSTRRNSVAIDPAADIWLDADCFESELKAAQPHSWREALRLYQGDFMADFTLRGAVLFDDWVTAERERLRKMALDGFAKLGTYDHQRGDLPGAIDDFQQLLRIDPWHEAAHRQLMRIHAERGDRAASLAQYEACRELLETELGVEPEPDTLELYAQIKAGKLSPTRSAVERIPADRLLAGFPAPTTSFHGREGEKTQIAAALAEPGCRMLTLTGPGGAGKTRLALEAVREMSRAHPLHFPDGWWFIPLAGVDSQAGIISAIAAGAGFSFSGPKEPRDQLFSFLQGKEALLVLDNFEQLVREAPLLVELLQAAPSIKMLVTSRERLNLYEEWSLPLEGLPFPGWQEHKLEGFEAVQLFIQRARRVNLSFQLAQETEGVRSICQIVEGLPLGIELAASWTRAFSTQEIAAAIRSNLGELDSSPRNIPDRQRSLQATFDYSWKLLTPEEQAALAHLAVFRGGFDRKAARQVAKAHDRLLANLVEKSLLRRGLAGRYELHDQLRHFAWEKLPPAGQASARMEHMQYFAAFLQEREAVMMTLEQHSALGAIQADFDNVRAAWQEAVGQQAYGYMDRMLEALFHYYMKRGLHRQGYHSFGEAVAALQPASLPPGDPQAIQLTGRLLVRQGRCGEFVSGDLNAPRRLLEQGLEIANNYNLQPEKAQALMGLGLLSLVGGKRDQAAEYLQASLVICQEQRLEWTMASALYLLGWIRNAEGDSEQAMALCEQALTIQRASGDTNGIAGALTTLGKIHSDRKDYSGSAQAYGEALEICRQSGHRVGAAQALTGLFGAHFRMGDYKKALDYAQQSLALNQDAGDRLGEAIAYHNLGVVLQTQHKHRRAIEQFQQALDLYRTIGADQTRIRNTQDYLDTSTKVVEGNR